MRAMSDHTVHRLDPNTPLGQTDYDQWTVTVPPKPRARGSSSSWP